MKKGNAENLEGKRGKKGGTQFPRYSLEHLLPLLNSLSSKTHTNTITIEQLNAGVFGIGANSTIGKVKSSALKQFGLITGGYTKISATELTTKITNSDGAEQVRYLQEAFRKVSVFVNAVLTFQNSKTDKVKIGQYAVSSLKVHPDMKDDFIAVLIESTKVAGLCTVEGNSVTFNSFPNDQATKTQEDDKKKKKNEENDDDQGSSEPQNSNGTLNTHENGHNSKAAGKVSNINVSIDVDPSMDPEKLEKLLKLLKSYGAI